MSGGGPAPARQATATVARADRTMASSLRFIGLTPRAGAGGEGLATQGSFRRQSPPEVEAAARAAPERPELLAVGVTVRGAAGDLRGGPPRRERVLTLARPGVVSRRRRSHRRALRGRG